tara:strand:- start:926 stop:1126 length:201 start_codon:yes stop_codon:yes gene_type:complete
MKIVLTKSTLVEIIRGEIKEVVNEATTTGSISGYSTPFAFGDGSKKSKKKKKKISVNSTGYKMVKK